MKENRIIFWILFFIIFAFTLHIFNPKHTYGHTKPQIDYSLLRDIICHWETRNLSERQKNDYVGTSGELGRCAIRPGTARWAGYRGSNINLISYPLINRAWAKEVLVRVCAPRVTNTAFALARCYNGGPKAKSKFSLWYAKIIAAKYAHAFLRRQN